MQKEFKSTNGQIYLDDFRYKQRKHLDDFLNDSKFNEKIIVELGKITKYQTPDWLYLFNVSYRVCTHLLHTKYPHIHLREILDQCDTPRDYDSSHREIYCELTLSIIYGLLGVRNIGHRYKVIEKIQYSLLNLVEGRSQYIESVKRLLDLESPIEQRKEKFKDFEYPTTFVSFTDDPIEDAYSLQGDLKILFEHKMPSLKADDVRSVMYALPTGVRESFLSIIDPIPELSTDNLPF